MTVALGTADLLGTAGTVALGATPGPGALTGLIATSATTPAVTAMATTISTGLLAGFFTTSGVLTGTIGVTSAACTSSGSAAAPRSLSPSSPSPAVRVFPSSRSRASSMRTSESTTIRCIFVTGRPSGSSTGPFGADHTL